MNTKIGAEIYNSLTGLVWFKLCWNGSTRQQAESQISTMDLECNSSYEFIQCNILTRIEKEKSLRHVAMVAKFADLNNPWSCKYGRDNNKKLRMYDFPVQDCTQEQNSSPFFSSIVRQSKWLSLSRKIVEIQKFCYHGNVTSHFFSVVKSLNVVKSGVTFFDSSTIFDCEVR